MASKEKGAKDFHAQKKVVNEILTSAKDGDLEKLQSVLENQVKSLILTTPSAADNDEEISVAVLLRDVKDAHKRTAAHFAASKGRRKVLKYIISQNNNVAPDWVDEEGSSPLYYAVAANEFSSVQLLLDAGASANVVLKTGVSALHQAAGNGSVRIVKALLSSGADINSSRTPNGTALHWAVSDGHVPVVEYLLTQSANVNARNEAGVTALMLATIMRKLDIIKILLTSGANVSMAIMGGVTAMHIAAETGFRDVLELFFSLRESDSKALASLKTDANVTPLQLAAGMGHADVVSFLQPFDSHIDDNDTVSDILKVEALRVAAEQQAEESATTPTVVEPEVEDDVNGVPDVKDIPMPSALGETIQEEAAVAAKTKGNALYAAKDFKKAIECYSQSILLNPMDPVFYSNRCAAYLACNEPKKALYDIRVAKKLKPDWSKATYREGQCLEALKLYEKAACAYWEVMKSPDKANDKNLKDRFQNCVKLGRKEFLQSQ